MRHIAQLCLLYSINIKTTEMEKPVLVDEYSSAVRVSSQYSSLQWAQPITAREIVPSTHKKHNPVAAAQHHNLFAIVGPI